MSVSAVPNRRPNPKIEVGDRVRLMRETSSVKLGFGTVFDLFDTAGKSWAQVEWSPSGNQYTPKVKQCKLHAVGALQLCQKAKAMTGQKLTELAA